MRLLVEPGEYWALVRDTDGKLSLIRTEILEGGGELPNALWIGEFQPDYFLSEKGILLRLGEGGNLVTADLGYPVLVPEDISCVSLLGASHSLPEVVRGHPASVLHLVTTFSTAERRVSREELIDPTTGKFKRRSKNRIYVEPPVNLPPIFSFGAYWDSSGVYYVGRSSLGDVRVKKVGEEWWDPFLPRLNHHLFLTTRPALRRPAPLEPYFEVVDAESGTGSVVQRSCLSRDPFRFRKVPYRNPPLVAGMEIRAGEYCHEIEEVTEGDISRPYLTHSKRDSYTFAFLLNNGDPFVKALPSSGLGELPKELQSLVEEYPSSRTTAAFIERWAGGDLPKGPLPTTTEDWTSFLNTHQTTKHHSKNSLWI